MWSFMLYTCSLLGSFTGFTFVLAINHRGGWEGQTLPYWARREEWGAISLIYIFLSLTEKQLGLVLYHYVHNYQKMYWSCSENKIIKHFYKNKLLSILIFVIRECRTIPDPESNFLSDLQVQQVINNKILTTK